MTFEYSQEIINDLEKLLETDKRYDVIIYASENENAKEIHAISNILSIRDDLFLDEIDIWDSLIKWSFAQHTSIQQDIKKWISQLWKELFIDLFV
ncbi:hypothetical protein C1645_873887 [Glomus cerebriforme]|uniref:BACK domain-containing protein n=1 Tax=Glomus cerebriforme TaxID=658196 RepID=A0A397T625_9GLOM|nr:hypothetical protein C1645_873887 [Glomus cerebriforme]